ncbi:hypothetical protein TWF696_000443 [Orbilia brochopaga]|uniref:JmjC domain-containing protein n=1 Tax=Orbilia brochopaga TaxID=3140254 RepID=A0AAV9VBA5_9PEZI
MTDQSSSPSAALRQLLISYADANYPSTRIEYLPHPPSPLEFLRIVSRNRPMIIRNAMTDWPAMGAGDGDKKWTVEYLKQQMGNAEVAVAETPLGNADSIIEHEGAEYFVKPCTRPHPFSNFLTDLISTNTTPNPSTILYAQSQDSNLTHEYTALALDVPPAIPWASIALDQPVPDALNLWIGNHHSVSSLHKDPYQNLYGVVLGTKIFTLINPFGVAAAQEKKVLNATYVKRDDGEFVVTKDQITSWGGQDALESTITWPARDLEHYFSLPDDERNMALEQIADDDPLKWVKLSTPMRVEVHAGEMLYLPALWYHQVAQRVDETEDVCVAVNYWYDMDFAGPFVSTASFVRNMTLLALKSEQEQDSQSLA